MEIIEEIKELEIIYTTQQEKTFLDEIGTFLAKDNRNRTSRKQLLLNYIKAANKRTDWLDMNKGEVLSYVYELLSKESLKT